MGNANARATADAFFAIFGMRRAEPTPVPPTVRGIRCPTCADVVWSRHCHDWRACKCGACFVDGGRNYLRVGGKPMPEVVTVCTATGAVVEDVTEGDGNEAESCVVL